MISEKFLMREGSGAGRGGNCSIEVKTGKKKV